MSRCVAPQTRLPDSADRAVHLVLSFSRPDIDYALFSTLIVFTFLQRARTIRTSACLQKAEHRLLGTAGIALECGAKGGEDSIESPDESRGDNDASEIART